MSTPEPAPPPRPEAAGHSLPEPEVPGGVPAAPAAPPAPALPPASTRASRRLEMRAAMLLIFMVLLLGGAALYLMWARGAFEATQHLILTSDDSEGVIVGMDLTFSGFPIGRVSQIALGEDANVLIQVDVLKSEAHWLRRSSVFTLERGLVGAARLRAFTGMRDDEPLENGAIRPVLRGDVSAEIPKMVADARDVLQNINKLTAAESSLAASLTELRVFSNRLNNHGKGGLLGAVTGNDADAKRVAELLDRTNQLIRSLDAVAVRVDGVVKKADHQVLGKDGLVTDAQASVRQLNALLHDARQTIVKVDGVLKEVQGVAGNAREATTNLTDLRGDVESSLRKIDSLITEVNRKWPFAPKDNEVKLP